MKFKSGSRLLAAALIWIAPLSSSVFTIALSGVVENRADRTQTVLQKNAEKQTVSGGILVND